MDAIGEGRGKTGAFTVQGSRNFIKESSSEHDIETGDHLGQGWAVGGVFLLRHLFSQETRIILLINVIFLEILQIMK